LTCFICSSFLLRINFSQQTMKKQQIDPHSSHAAALRDQEAIRKAAEKINVNRSTARAFLRRVGIITPSGKLTKSYR